MYQRVLLCYDGSREGRAALREGAELAIAVKADIHVLAILPALIGSVVPEGITDAYIAHEQSSAQAVLAEGVKWLEERGSPAKGELVFGNPYDEIPRMARRLEVDLIVMGHRPLGRLARWWAGPGCGQILDRVHCSILVAVSADPPPA